ncbi:MAG: polysaccharide biosynthesis/export family protein [Candidatus Omnitrophica bacterium]|nr:polysaccharide biosynthesis/export family protein [Candidatus Omnitrophota bacterium]
MEPVTGWRQTARNFFLLLPAVLLSSAVWAADFADDTYLLRPGDELEVSVIGRQDMNRKIQIREDGTCFFPPIGEVSATGRPMVEVESEIADRLRAYLAEQAGPDTSEDGGHITSDQIDSTQVYRIQVSDELEISVWGQDDLNRKVPVREDGSFSFPLIGRVEALGRSLQEVEKEVQERLDKDYIVNPQVDVQLIGAKFSVLGEVVNPGPYSLIGAMDLLTALSQAGGLTKDGSSKIDVVRTSPDKKVTIRVNLDNVLQGREPNLTVLPRDSIMVYPKEKPAEEVEVLVRLVGAKFTVLGEVERPGSYPLEGFADVLTAISQAGGLSQFGSNRIELIRNYGGEKRTVRINLDKVINGEEPNHTILPGDTVYVKRRFF